MWRQAMERDRREALQRSKWGRNIWAEVISFFFSSSLLVWNSDCVQRSKSQRGKIIIKMHKYTDKIVKKQLFFTSQMRLTSAFLNFAASPDPFLCPDTHRGRPAGTSAPPVWGIPLSPLWPVCSPWRSGAHFPRSGQPPTSSSLWGSPAARQN